MQISFVRFETMLGKQAKQIIHSSHSKSNKVMYAHKIAAWNTKGQHLLSD